MFAIRSIGVAIALSAATAAFADQPVQWRADELSFNHELTREQVIAEYQAARAANLIVEGEHSMPWPELTAPSTVDRAQVQAEATAARDAGLHTLGER